MNAEGTALPDFSGDVAAVHAVTEALRRAVNCSDIDGIIACWAPDGIMLPPYHAAVHGRAAISAYFASVFATRRLTFAFTESTVEVFGNVAIERLHYTAVATTRAGETIQDLGKGIHIYTRRSEGGWQLAHDIWNSDRYPSAPAQT